MSIVITARISEKEYEEIHPLIIESGLTTSAFIKKLINTKKNQITIKNDVELIAIQKQLLFQINKIGNNINQLTKLLNQKEKDNLLSKNDLIKALYDINCISNILINKVR